MYSGTVATLAHFAIFSFFFSSKTTIFFKKKKILRFSTVKIGIPTNFIHLRLKMTLKMCQKVRNLGLRTALKTMQKVMVSNYNSFDFYNKKHDFVHLYQMKDRL